MSKSRLISYSNKFPTLAEWSKGFRHRNSTAPRSTIGNPSIAGNLYNFFFSIPYHLKRIFCIRIALGFQQLNLGNVENMTAVEIYPGM